MLYPSIYISIRLSIYPSIYLSIYLSIYPYIYLLILYSVDLINFLFLRFTITGDFYEKVTLSYLCALGIDRQSQLNECTFYKYLLYEISCSIITNYNKYQTTAKIGKVKGVS